MKKKPDRKKILHELSIIKKYDLAHFTGKITPINTKNETTAPINKEMVDEDLKYITDNFYTFLWEPPKNKPFFLIRKLIFSFLFKYSFRQVRFNDHLRNLLLRMNQAFLQNNEKLEKQDVFTKKLVEEYSEINNKLDRQDLLTKKLVEEYSDINKKNALTQKNIDELYLIHMGNNSKINALEEKVELLEHGDKSNSISRYFSQFGEDQWIINNLHLPKDGTYIDVGAADGITFSNTYYFEKLGWQGICFEPDPDNYIKAKNCRKNVINAAISNKSSTLDFYVSSISSDWSSLKPTSKHTKVIKVKTFTLNDIIKSNKITNIDILSIDTEGTEIDVWNSIDLKKIRPKVLIIEFNNQGIINNKLLPLIIKSNYKLVHQTHANYILIDDKK